MAVDFDSHSIRLAAAALTWRVDALLANLSQPA